MDILFASASGVTGGANCPPSQSPEHSIKPPPAEVSWGLGRPTGGRRRALPDGSDGGLQGGDHVFDEEVIPVVPVFRHGLARPGIWEGDSLSAAGHGSPRGSTTSPSHSCPGSTSRVCAPTCRALQRPPAVAPFSLLNVPPITQSPSRRCLWFRTAGGAALEGGGMSSGFQRGPLEAAKGTHAGIRSDS